VLHHLIAIAVLAAYLASLTGWGGLTHRLCLGATAAPWTWRAALGLPTVAVIGALLNLTHLARPAALDTLTAIGLALLAWQGWNALRERRARPVPPLPAPGWGARAADLVPRAMIGAAALFLVVTVLPTGVFNHHDDMHKYLVPPVRMLATGSLGDNPFETTGFYSLGLQPFFQAFGAAHFPLTYLNAFDMVLCFLLTGLLVDDLGRRMGATPPFRTLAMLLLVVINPQYVNVSSVFSGSLAAAGLTMAGLLLGERIGAAPPAQVARAAVPVGLFAALLLGLKLTHLPFAALFLLVLLLLLPHLAGGFRPAGPAVGGFLAGAAALGLPWTAVYDHTFLGPLARYLKRFLFRATGGSHAAAPAPDAATGGMGHLGGGAPAHGPAIAKAFSGTEVYFGQTALAYGLVVLGVGAACVLAAIWLLRHRRDPDPDRTARAGLAAALAAGAAVVAYYLAFPYVFSITQGIRYTAPLLIPTAALAVLAAARAGAGAPPRRATLHAVAVTFCAALLAGPFLKGTAGRIDLATHVRTLLVFPMGPPNVALNRFAFHPSTREALRDAQGSIPQGAPVLAWLATPFHLDFRRNPVYTIPDPDFTVLWLHMPVTDHPADLAAFLRERGIRYVMWDYNVPGMRSEAELKADLTHPRYARRGKTRLRLRRVLAALARQGGVLYDTGHRVVFALPPAPGGETKAIP
jgi:hypothetical protein